MGIADCIVHSVASRRASSSHGGYLDRVTREGFRIAHDISSYSPQAPPSAGRPLMQGRARAIVTLIRTRGRARYPVTTSSGLAKASLEANVRFLAADLGPQGYASTASRLDRSRRWPLRGSVASVKCCTHVAAATPLRRNVSIDEAGNAAAFLLGSGASGITGEVPTSMRATATSACRSPRTLAPPRRLRAHRVRVAATLPETMGLTRIAFALRVIFAVRSRSDPPDRQPSRLLSGEPRPCWSLWTAFGRIRRDRQGAGMGVGDDEHRQRRHWSGRAACNWPAALGTRRREHGTDEFRR